MADAIISEQTLVFFQAAALGIATGMFYDVLRVFRLRSKMRIAACIVCDIIFCFFLLIALFFFIMGPACGMVRSYVFIGLVCGAALYFMSASGAVVAGVRALLDAVSKGVHAAAGALRCAKRAAKELQGRTAAKIPANFSVKSKKNSLIFRRNDVE